MHAEQAPLVLQMAQLAGHCLHLPLPSNTKPGLQRLQVPSGLVRFLSHPKGVSWHWPLIMTKLWPQRFVPHAHALQDPSLLQPSSRSHGPPNAVQNWQVPFGARYR